MTSTLSSLIAKLGDCPKTEEFLAQHARLVYPESAYAEMFNEADAALLELAERLEEQTDYVHDLEEWLAQVRERSEVLLKERNALRDDRDRWRRRAVTLTLEPDSNLAAGMRRDIVADIRARVAEEVNP